MMTRTKLRYECCSRNIFMLFITTALLLAGALPALAQPYPQRPVRIVVPLPPGGAVDATARSVAQHFNATFHQPFVVDNRPGAGGSIGIERVVKSAPDGYTLLVSSAGIVTNAAVRPQNYDPVRDLQGVSNLRVSLYLLVVTPSLPVKSVRDLVNMARAKPDGVSYGTTGIGSITHLGAELLTMLSGTRMLSVPYKGVAEGYPAVASGDVNWTLGGSGSALPLVRAGRLRALAVTSSKRSKALPDLPTVAESGVPDYEFVGWVALFAPAGTPMALVEKLSAEARRSVQSPAFIKSAEADGSEVLGSTPQELALTVRTELQKWRKVVQSAGIGG